MTQDPPSQLLLVVDDDPGQVALLSGFLSRRGFRTITASRPDEVFPLLQQHDVDMIISDVRMPGMSGIDMFREVRKTHPRLPVLLVTAFPGVRDAVEAMRDGAANYLEKPIDLDELLSSVRHGLGFAEPLPQDAEPAFEPPSDVIAESPVMRDLLREALLVAPTDSRVLLTGESGTGKEVLADFLQSRSLRASGPFVKVNCASIPETLLESELFGHERGAFTGAVAKHVGYFEQVNGGTILLDEIGEMSPNVQAKLLRVTQDGSFRRIGGTQSLRVDVRIIASTNRDLEQDIAAGRFREDLFYRLNVFELHIPPLRERPEDVVPLARFFGSRFGGRAPRLSPAAIALIKAYNWPGNVRELRNAMERASLISRGDLILPQHLPPRVQGTIGFKSESGEENTQQNSGMKAIERSIILETLKNQKYNRSETARILGISRRALIYKLHRFREEGYLTGPEGTQND